MSLQSILAGLIAVSLGCTTDEPTGPEGSSQTVAVGERAKAADAFVSSIGTNVHLSYFDRVYGSGYDAIIKPKIAKLGIRHLRDGGLVWPDVAWMNAVYGRYREVSALTGAKFTVIMSSKGTASGFGQDYTDASHLYTLLDYIGRDNVAAFEGPNEHDLSGRANWVAEVRALQRAIYATVKGDAALRRYQVIGPSVTSYWAAGAIGNLSASMDYGNMHPYPGGHEPLWSLGANVAGLRPLNGTRRLQATETGYHNAIASTSGHPGISETAMGRYVPRLFLEYFNASVVRTFTYELIDQGTGDEWHEGRFGLLRIDGSEKPAFVALANLIALLSDRGSTFTPSRLSYSLSGNLVDLHRTLLQKRNGRFYLILWLEVPSYDLGARADIPVPARPITMTLGASHRARVFVPLAASAPQSVVTSRRVRVNVADHPVVIELTRSR